MSRDGKGRDAEHWDLSSDVSADPQWIIAVLRVGGEASELEQRWALKARNHKLMLSPSE